MRTPRRHDDVFGIQAQTVPVPCVGCGGAVPVPPEALSRSNPHGAKHAGCEPPVEVA